MHSDPIKVLFLLSNFKPGGAETQYINLINGIDKKKFKVFGYFICHGENVPSEKFIEQFHCPTHICTRRNAFDFTPIIQISNFAIKNSIDIIQSLLFLDNQIARFAGLLSKKTVITSVRGEIGPILGNRKAYFEYKMQLLSNKTIVNSHWLKKYLIQNGGCGRKIRVIYNGINFDRFQKQGDLTLIREKYAIPADARIVGIVARLHPMKNHKCFLDAIKIVKQTIPSVYGLIIGDGQERKQLEKYAATVGLQNNVQFLGSVTQDIGLIYQLMEAFVLTSSYGESFPNVVCEAMSASIPVIASNISAIPEIIQDGKNGYLCRNGNATQFADRILQLLSNEIIRQKFIDNGLATVLNFGITKMVQKYEFLYNSYR